MVQTSVELLANNKSDPSNEGVFAIDAMAEVQSLDKPEQIHDCLHLANHFIGVIFEKYWDSDEIRLIFARYDIPSSL